MFGRIFSFASNLVPGVAQAWGALTVLKYVICVGLPLLFVSIFVYKFIYMEHHIQADATQLQQQLDKMSILDETIKSQTSALSSWAEYRNKSEQEFRAYSQRQSDATAIEKDLYNVFEKHDLGALSQRKPSAIELRVNRGSDVALRMLSCTTNPTASGCSSQHSPAAISSSSPSTISHKRDAGKVENPNP